MNIKQIIREEIQKVINEFGPMYASQNRTRKSSNPLVRKIGELDSLLMNTTNSKAEMEWDLSSSEILGQNNAKYWSDLDDQDLEDAIHIARGIIKKYKL